MFTQCDAHELIGIWNLDWLIDERSQMKLDLLQVCDIWSFTDHIGWERHLTYPVVVVAWGLEKNIVSCTSPEKNRVGRLGKKDFWIILFGQKCVFYACFTLIGSWEGGKKIRVQIFFQIETC